MSGAHGDTGGGRRQPPCCEVGGTLCHRGALHVGVSPCPPAVHAARGVFCVPPSYPRPPPLSSGARRRTIAGVVNRIREVRLRRGLTQSELARRVGISRQLMWNYEHEGQGMPNVTMALEIARELRTTVEELWLPAPRVR